MAAEKKTTKAVKKAKPTAKKAPAKVTKTAKPEASLETRVKALEERITKLEQHDFTQQAEEAYKSVSSTLKEKYAANPTAAIAVGVALIFFILLIL